MVPAGLGCLLWAYVFASTLGLVAVVSDAWPTGDSIDHLQDPLKQIIFSLFHSSISPLLPFPPQVAFRLHFDYVFKVFSQRF